MMEFEEPQCKIVNRRYMNDYLKSSFADHTRQEYFHSPINKAESQEAWSDKRSSKHRFRESRFGKVKFWKDCLIFAGFICFFVGCTYQSSQFLKLYLDYPTSVEFNVVNSQSLGFPAVTFCSNNRIRLKQWCETDPEVCLHFSNETRKDYVQRLQEKYKEMNKTERIRLAPQMEEFILYVEFEEKEQNETMTQFYDYQYNNCFTFNAAWGPAARIVNATLFNPVTGKSSEMVACVNMDKKNYSPLSSSIIVRMSVHADDIVPNPRYKGVSLDPGRFYSYGVQKNGVYLLEAPFQTNCRNYTNEMEVRTGGRMSQENCLLECYKFESIKECGCTYDRLALLYDGKRCDQNNKSQIPCLENQNEKTKNTCYTHCRMACKKVTYKYITADSEPLRKESSLYERMNISDTFRNNYSTMAEEIACIRVNYGSTETTTVTHYPKYNFIEVFSLIGGYTGLWLGFSFLAGFSYVVSGFEILRKRHWPPNKKRRTHKKKSKKETRIGH